MLRIAFNIKFNANTVAEALVEADELVAEFLNIPATQVAERVNSELRVELAEPKDGVDPSARFAVTVIGTLKNGFVFTPTP